MQAELTLVFEQVVDKLPLTVEALAQSGLGKLIKYVVEHPPTTGESCPVLSLSSSSFLYFLLCVHACRPTSLPNTSRKGSDACLQC